MQGLPAIIDLLVGSGQHATAATTDNYNIYTNHEP